MSKRALVAGASGQTGALLAARLVRNGYHVVGASRDTDVTDWWRLEHLGITEDVERVSLNPNDLDSVISSVKAHIPDEIYFLAGQSSVALSFSQPTQAFESNAGAVLNFLEAMRLLESPAHFFNAASTDCFGDQSGKRLDESSSMEPVSPYGVAKAASFRITVNYRDSFGIHASNGILSNHESVLRGRAFVTQKIVSTLRERASSADIPLVLGNTAVSRDWLWAEDVVQAIHMICSESEPEDYVVASGVSHSIHEFVVAVCKRLGLDHLNPYVINEKFYRPHEILSVQLNPEKIQKKLGWCPSVDFEGLVSKLLERV